MRTDRAAGRGWIGSGETALTAVFSSAYPSHSRPNFWHRRQPGFPSSHLTRRTLCDVSRRSQRAHSTARDAYLHVMQPDLTLGLLARIRFVLAGRDSAMAAA